MYITGKPHPPKAVSSINKENIVLEMYLFLVSFESTWKLNLKSHCLFSICWFITNNIFKYFCNAKITLKIRDATCHSRKDNLIILTAGWGLEL